MTIEDGPVCDLVCRPQWAAVQASGRRAAANKVCKSQLERPANQCLEPACSSLCQPASQPAWCYVGGRDCAEYISALYTVLAYQWSIRTFPRL